MKTYEVLFVTPHGNGWAIINSDTVSSVKSILENQSKFQPLDILHIKERKVICGLNTSIIYEGHCETLMSPYDLAVSQGYEGSLEEWLESLKGESAYEIWLDQGHTGTEEDFLDWLRESSSTNLYELNDVDIDSPSDNQALIYNKTTHKWENKNIPAISVVNDATLTIKQGSSTLGTFTANQSVDNDISIPQHIFINYIDGIVDYDGNEYHEVTIGNQTWLIENLKTTCYLDGTPISQGTSLSSTPSWYFPDNNSSYKDDYGLLYNWYTVNNQSNNFIDGYHVPSNAEWTQLFSYVKNQSEYWCNNNSNRLAKALASIIGWNRSLVGCSPGNNPNVNNATGFSAMPAGFYSGSYVYFSTFARLWSNTEEDSNYAYNYFLYFNEVNFGKAFFDKTWALSVRLIKNT